MVVLDSSALIPLAQTGNLDLLYGAYNGLRTVQPVVSEVVVAGKPGSAALDSFLDDVDIHETADDASQVAELEGLAETDAAVVLLAASLEEPLLANDRALIVVARSHGVECDWVTTLLLRCTASGVLDADEAGDVLYELVESGMHLDPRVYARIQDRLDDLD